MISNNTKDSVAKLIASNPDIQSAFDQVVEENQLFLSKFTHELRNPLTLVKSTIQLIESQHPEVVNFKYWNQIMSDINDTVTLLNELSVYNHCDQIIASNINLTALVRECIENVQPYAQPKGTEIIFILDEHTQIYESYTCDRIKMKQAITNLLKNAIEAAVEHSVIRMSLSVITKTEVSEQYITLSITNSGEAIEPDTLEHIFEPFVTTKPNGSGLGLAICHKIATLHQGSLTVSQTEGQVTFSLQLPTNVA